MNKLTTLMKATRCKKEPDGDFAITLNLLLNEESPKDLRIQIMFGVKYQSGRAQEVAACQPIDPTETLNTMAGRLPNAARRDNFEKEEAAKEKAAREEAKEKLAAKAKKAK